MRALNPRLTLDQQRAIDDAYFTLFIIASQYPWLDDAGAAPDLPTSRDGLPGHVRSHHNTLPPPPTLPLTSTAPCLMRAANFPDPLPSELLVPFDQFLSDQPDLQPLVETLLTPSLGNAGLGSFSKLTTLYALLALRRGILSLTKDTNVRMSQRPATDLQIHRNTTSSFLHCSCLPPPYRAASR